MTGNGECEGLKITLEIQSAAKLRIGEGSEIIPNGSRIVRSEAASSWKQDEDMIQVIQSVFMYTLLQ